MSALKHIRYKNIWLYSNSIHSWGRVWLTKNKTRPQTCSRFDSCFWFLWKCKSFRNYNYNYLHIKVSLNFLVKSCYIVFFHWSLDHNKTTCRTPTANPRQLCSHWLESFATVMIIFWGFHVFLIYLGKCFCALLDSCNWLFQQFVCKSNVN